MNFRVVLLAMLFVLPGVEVSALDPPVFSNLNQPDVLPLIGRPVTVGLGDGMAIPFTTDGTNTELTKVRIFFGSAGANDIFRVSITEVDPVPVPSPGTQVTVLSGPASPDPKGSDYVPGGALRQALLATEPLVFSGNHQQP